MLRRVKLGFISCCMISWNLGGIQKDEFHFIYEHLCKYGDIDFVCLQEISNSRTFEAGDYDGNQLYLSDVFGWRRRCGILVGKNLFLVS